MLYTLNLYNVICQLYLNKSGGGKEEGRSKSLETRVNSRFVSRPSYVARLYSNRLFGCLNKCSIWFQFLGQITRWKFLLAAFWASYPKHWVRISPLEATHVPIDRGRNKQNVVITCSGTLFNLEREGNFDTWTCYNMDEPEWHLNR